MGDTTDDKHLEQDTQARTPGRRNRFFRHKRMNAEEFRTEQAYFIQRRRLITRSVMGWGVVFGLAAQTAEGSSVFSAIGRGLALDRMGREIEVPEPRGVTLSPRNVFLLVDNEQPLRPLNLDQMEADEERYLLSIHYAEYDEVDAHLPDDCGCPRKEHQFVRETVLFSLRRVDGDRCLERACPGKGAFAVDACDDDRLRGPHRQLSEWSQAHDVSDETTVCMPWNRHQVDASRGVPLGYVMATRPQQACTALSLTLVDAHTPRVLLKRNDMLYDLIRGCDLTRIKSISWDDLHRWEEKDPIPYQSFVDLMRLGPPEGDAKEMATGLTVTFSGPVDRNTLKPDCFSLNFMVQSVDAGWRDVRFVPVVGLDCEAEGDRDPPNSTRAVTLKVDTTWVEQVIGRAHVLHRSPFFVEILVHGDFILDCRGQAIDANARGLSLSEKSPGAGGNGTPGGTFRSLLSFEMCPANKTASPGRRPAPNPTGEL